LKVTAQKKKGYSRGLAHLPHLVDSLFGGSVDEFSPEEFGVSHPTLKAFIPLDDLGSRMVGGKPAGEQSCAKGTYVFASQSS
jgi:hypothetical protein